MKRSPHTAVPSAAAPAHVYESRLESVTTRRVTVRVPSARGGTRRLHSSTFRLNVSAFDGIGGAFRGC